MDQLPNYCSERQELLPKYEDITPTCYNKLKENVEFHMICGLYVLQLGLGNILVGVLVENPECLNDYVVYNNIIHGSLLMLSGFYLMVITLYRIPFILIRLTYIYCTCWAFFFINMSVRFFITYDVECQPFLMRWNLVTIILSILFGGYYSILALSYDIT